MINHKRNTVFVKSALLSNGENDGCCTIFVEDLKERDRLQDVEEEQRVVVIDASDDDRVSGKTAEYVRKGNEWILISSLVEGGDNDNSFMILENEKQLELLEPLDGHRVYIKDNEKEYIYVGGEWKTLGNSGNYGEVHAKDIITDNALQFISREQKKIIGDNRSEIELLKQMLGTIDVNSSGKTKIDEEDKMGFLEDKIGTTITVEDNLLEVVKILGQIVTVNDINQLDGIQGNVQDQIDALSRIGNFTGSVDNKNELSLIQNAGLNDMVIVLEDEDNDDESTIYMHNGTEWEYVGKFNIKLEDIEAEDIKIKDTKNKFPVSKNIEVALSYLADKFDDVEVSITELEDCCNSISNSVMTTGGVIQVPKRKDLPELGDTNTAYIVDEDETNNKSTSLYIWQYDENSGKGFYVLLITATVGGKMQEYQQVTKLGVKAPRDFELTIPRTQNFLRAPVEVLRFDKGENDVKVDTRYSNHSENDFYFNGYINFWQDGFTLKSLIEKKFEKKDFNEVKVDKKECVKSLFFSPDIKNSGPGSKQLTAGNLEYGYFGKIQPKDFFTIEGLMNQTGEVGSYLIDNSEFHWNKFYSEGKILYITSRAIRKSLSWNRLNENGMVDGTKEIYDKYGNKYRVRLIRGLNKDADYLTQGVVGDNLKGSEWNRLLLPMNHKSKNGDWEYPDLVESDLPNWGMDLTDDDFGIGGNKDGRSIWCMENYNSSGKDGYARGTARSIEWYASASKTWSGSNMGWMPVLELVEEPMIDGSYIVYINGEYRSYEEGGMRVINGPLTPESFLGAMVDSTYITNEDVEEMCHSEFTIYTNSDAEKVGMVVKPKNSLLLANGDLSIKSVDNIDFFRVDYTKNGDADLLLIVSVDEGETWMTYESGGWEVIEPIEQSVLESGISPGVLGNIPSVKWNELRQYSEKIRFGYLINYNEDGAELKVHALNAQFDMTGVWKSSIHGKDFNYEYPDNSTIKVNILNDGDYKINY